MRNKLKNTIAGLFLVLLVAGWPFTFYLLHQNEELTIEITERDNLIHDARSRDSSFLGSTKNYSDTINKYISGCEITINGKIISVQDLIGMLNNSYKDNAKLQDSLANLQMTHMRESSLLRMYLDSFSIYKNLTLYSQKKTNSSYKINKDDKGVTFIDVPNGYDSAYANKKIIEYIKRDFGIEYEVNFNDEKKVYTFNRKPSIADSANMFKKILELEKKVYMIDYKIEPSGDLIYYSVNSPTLDSALMLFPFFKHMLKENKNKKEWNINISPKKVREARRVITN